MLFDSQLIIPCHLHFSRGRFISFFFWFERIFLIKQSVSWSKRCKKWARWMYKSIDNYNSITMIKLLLLVIGTQYKTCLSLEANINMTLRSVEHRYNECKNQIWKCPFGFLCVCVHLNVHKYIETPNQGFPRKIQLDAASIVSTLHYLLLLSFERWD